MLLLFVHFFKSCETQISVAQAQDIFLNDSSDESPSFHRPSLTPDSPSSICNETKSGVHSKISAQHSALLPRMRVWQRWKARGLNSDAKSRRAVTACSLSLSKSISHASCPLYHQDHQSQVPTPISNTMHIKASQINRSRYGIPPWHRLCYLPNQPYFLSTTNTKNL